MRPPSIRLFPFPTTLTALLVLLSRKTHSWQPRLATTASSRTRSRASAFCGTQHGGRFLWRAPAARAAGPVVLTRTPLFLQGFRPAVGASRCFSDRSPSFLRSSASGDNDSSGSAPLKVGDKVQVEVVSFGPLGASVEVVGLGHGEGVDLLPLDAEPYGIGLITQQEISYFRAGRGNVDVVRGEVLEGVIQKVRDEDGKVDVSLRSFGGKAKADEVGTMILDKLRDAPDGVLPVGDKSSPAEISAEFPGVSKGVFKKAVGGLYKKGLVLPSPKSIALK